jgi:hypothetical protein
MLVDSVQAIARPRLWAIYSPGNVRVTGGFGPVNSRSLAAIQDLSRSRALWVGIRGQVNEGRVQLLSAVMSGSSCSTTFNNEVWTVKLPL